MGYGKTTAMNWYLAGRAKAEDATVVRISVYSDHPVIFWKSVQDAFEHAGLPLLRGYAFPDDAAGASLLADDLCHGLAGRGSVYIFIDDFHLLTDGRITEFLCALVNRLPENVHLIVASRDRFLPGDAVVRLGSRVYPIGAEHLRLNHTELAIYAHRCGTDLTDAQVETLLHASEGWFSAVYLNLRTLSERGTLPDRHSDIYTMFSAAMIEPLSPRQQEFLAVMGLADEFTAPMARFVTGDPDTDRLLTMLTEQNAFVTRLPDGVSYRFHHMMKVCAEQAFAALPEQTRRAYHGRYGAWYAAHGQYLHALAAYRKGEDYDAVLQVIQDDAGILLAALSPEEVLAFLDACPRDTLQAHPLTLLVLMRRMFTWQQIPKMLELRALLLAGIEAHPELPDAERGNLLGECDLIMSFLQYNDITAMSRLHRSAAVRMTRPAISIRNEGSWTFGSPSVLMMFHRTPGQLGAELDAMNACMPHYYRLTNGHGQGAEQIMDAEAALLQGRFADAAIFLEQARRHRRKRAGEHGTLLRLSGAPARAVRRHRSARAPGAEACRPARAARHDVAAHLRQRLRLLRRAGRADRTDPRAVSRPRAAHGAFARAVPPHDGNDRKSGLSRRGRLRPGDRAQRGTARAVRAAALCARRAAGAHPDERCLRRARQAAGGAQPPRSGTARRGSPTVCCCRLRKTAAACTPCWRAARGRRAWVISRSGQQTASRPTRRAAPRCARPAARRRSSG